MSLAFRTLLFVVALVGAGQAPAATEVADPSKFTTREVAISGSVEHPRVLDVDALRKFPPQKVALVPLVCQTGANVGKLENFKGVRLRDLLEDAVIEAPGHNDVKTMVIIAGASDGYRVVFSWSEVFNSPVGDGVLVFFEKDGLPLDDAEGRIAMISANDIRTGPRHVKWLNSIEVVKIVD